MKYTTQNSSFSKRGFTLLFSVLMAALLLAIGLGIFNIVFRELQLSTLTRDSDTALYAADAGLECALYWEFKGLAETPSVYFDNSPGNATDETIKCGGITNINADVNVGTPTTTWSFVMPVGEVTTGDIGCAVVDIEKNGSRISVISSGRNQGGDNPDCDPGERTVERTLEAHF